MSAKNAQLIVLSISFQIETDGSGRETRSVVLQTMVGPDLAVSVKCLQEALTIAHVVEKLWTDTSAEQSREVA